MKFSKCASLTKGVFNDTNKSGKCYDFFWYVYMCRNANNTAFKFHHLQGCHYPKTNTRLFYRANQGFALK